MDKGGKGQREARGQEAKGERTHMFWDWEPVLQLKLRFKYYLLSFLNICVCMCVCIHEHEWDLLWHT